MVEKLNMVQRLNASQQARSNIVVAASGRIMADGLSQDPMLAQVRMRNGDMVYVKDLDPIDSKNPQPNGDYQVALVKDHTGKVEDQVGAVWLFIKNQMLHALVVWTNDKTVNKLKALADDGFLQFSTEGYVSEIDDDGKYGDFWIDTLSPVTSGNDPATQVLNQADGRILIKNAIRFNNEGEEMVKKPQDHKKKVTKNKATKEENDITPEEEQAIVDKVTANVLAELQGEEEEPVENDADDDDTEEEEEDDSTEEVEDGEEEEEETVPAKNKVRTTPKTPVANAKPKQLNVKVTNEKRGEQEEIIAFSNALAQAIAGRTGEAGVREAMNVYHAKAGHKKNIITGDDFLPTSLATTFIKAWADNTKMSFVKYVNSRAGAVYAAKTDDTALDHKPGDLKLNQDLDLVRRDLKAIAVYKRLPIDAQDLFDDHNGELVKLRTEELVSRIQNQILKAIVLGGNTPGSVGSTNGVATGGRGLYGIIPDAAGNSDFQNAVATEVEGVTDEDAYAAVVRTLDAVDASSNGSVATSATSPGNITLITYKGWLAEFLLTKNDPGGQYMFTRDNINSMLGLSNIITMPELNASKKLVAVKDGAYQVYGEKAPKMFPRFDDEYNQDVLLAEQFVAGSLADFESAAVYVPDAVS